MTSEELKLNIDTDITNKISAKSISPTNVGENLKNIVDYIDQEITDYIPPVQNILIDSNSFNGTGQSGNPLKNKVYYRTSQIIASGSNSPVRAKNFFSGMSLPDGITETFSRVSSGIYRITYSGADTILDLDLTLNTRLFQFKFSDMPTNTGSNLKIQQIGSTNANGIRTIFVEFHNLPNDILTDNFNGYLYYEVKFFQ